jgi:hypothetical protein
LFDRSGLIFPSLLGDGQCSLKLSGHGGALSLKHFFVGGALFLKEFLLESFNYLHWLGKGFNPSNEVDQIVWKRPVSDVRPHPRDFRHRKNLLARRSALGFLHQKRSDEFVKPRLVIVDCF